MDASGTVNISSNPKLLGMNFAHREYFKTAINNPDPRILQVSAPFKTVLNDFAFTLLRTFLGPDGKFAGIVVVTEVPAYFANLLDSVRYAPDVRTWIAHGDGVLFLSLPHIDDLEGTDLKGPGTFFARHLESGQSASVFTGISLTGGQRMTAQQTLQLLDNPIMDKPIVIGVSRQLDGMFASWHQDALVRGELFLVVLLVTTVSLLLYQRKQQVYDRLMVAQEGERKKVELDLKESEQRWRFALEGAGDGVWDRNIETGKVAFSRRWKEMLGYRDEEIGDSFDQWKELVHPDDLGLALATIEAYQKGTHPNYVLEHRLLCKDGSWKWILSRGMIVDRKADGTPLRMIGTHSDITERKHAEEQIEALAFYDHLTGLPNRRLLADRMNQILAARVRNQHEGALLFIDLDNFKAVNDTQGHEMGDLLLQEVGRRLSNNFREADTVARIGGDEFVLALADLSENAEEAATQAKIVGEKILAVLGEPYWIKENQFSITPSVGVTLFGDHRGNVDELMKRADIAMYQAKAEGRNTIRFFDPGLQATIKARATLEADMRQGIREDQFILHYQPQVNGDGRLTGAEALLRWQHPQRGVLLPDEFIPLAEETGFILHLGRYVLEEGCARIVAWSQRSETSCLTLAVNVSARQFHQADFVEQVMAIVNRTRADPKKLKLELTESLLLENIEKVISKMASLKAIGVGFSLDDFGTGYSSLNYLKRLPLDQLKIDRSFVRDVLTDPNDAAIAKTIIALADSLGLGVIAEGVETEAQRNFLAASGCNAYQGYFYSRPLPLEGFEQFARQR
ncbi:MAG TPA: EAL domain-containing protein [Rhodospirillaceae bacterium]|nr:EAL domain-containing protein [Rhodospirillaceae bacterium]